MVDEFSDRFRPFSSLTSTDGRPRTTKVHAARDVLAEPDLTSAYEERGVFHAVEHQAHERFALEDDTAVHWLRATSGLLHENTDNAVSPGPACIIR